MYAIRKSDMKEFETRANDVCRIEEGGTNAHLRQDRAVEESSLRVESPGSSALLPQGTCSSWHRRTARRSVPAARSSTLSATIAHRRQSKARQGGRRPYRERQVLDRGLRQHSTSFRSRRKRRRIPFHGLTGRCRSRTPRPKRRMSSGSHSMRTDPCSPLADSGPSSRATVVPTRDR